MVCRRLGEMKGFELGEGADEPDEWDESRVNQEAHRPLGSPTSDFLKFNANSVGSGTEM